MTSEIEIFTQIIAPQQIILDNKNQEFEVGR